MSTEELIGIGLGLTALIYYVLLLVDAWLDG